MIRWPLAAICAALTLCNPGSLDGQAERPAGLGEGDAHIRGRVVDLGTGTPLAGAEVTIRSADGARSDRVVTPEDGTFLFAFVPLGSYDIEIRRLAYEDLDLSVDTGDGRQVSIQAHMVHDALEMEPLVVTSANRDRLEWAGFYDRRQAGLGRFFTRAEVQDRNVMHLSDLFRSIPGYRVIPSRSGPTRTIVGRGNCQPTLYVDGVRLRTVGGGNLDQVLEPDHLEGLEVYSGAQTPAQFQAGRCGTVVAWTHTPSERSDEPFEWRRFGIVLGLVVATFTFVF